MASPVCKKRKTSVKNYSSSVQYCLRSTVRQRVISSNGGRGNSSNDVGPLFCRLPLEMVTNILSYLDVPSLACCGSTCKKLRLHCNLMWERVCNRLRLNCQPRILCVVKTSRMNSIYRYDNAVKRCTSQNRYKTSAVRNWLCSRGRCVVCYRNGSQQDKSDYVTLCETCHPLFYRRKCHAKEEFSLTDKDLQGKIDSESREFLVSDLITIARSKYGSDQGLQARLQERKQTKEKRESEKQCALVTREKQVVSALRDQGTSYEDVSGVDAKTTHPYVVQHLQSAEDAAKWLVSCKNKQETRCKALQKEIKVRTSRCKRCQARIERSGSRNSRCRHITQAEVRTMMRFIQQNFKEDIVHYSKFGLLYLEPGACDDEYKSVQELMARHERKCELQLEIEKLKILWPDFLNGKDPMQSPFAHDFIYKGVAHLEDSVYRSALRTASDVSNVIKNRATGRDSRKKEILQELTNKGIICEVKELKLQSRKLVEDFIESSAVVRRQHIIACTAFETMKNVALIEGHNLKGIEETTYVAQRCARIYAECNPKPEYKSVQNQRRKALLSCLNIESLRELGSNKQSCRQAASDFINCGSTKSLFGYSINTPNAVASVIQLKEQILGQKTNALPSSVAS